MIIHDIVKNIAISKMNTQNAVCNQGIRFCCILFCVFGFGNVIQHEHV